MPQHFHVACTRSADNWRMKKIWTSIKFLVGSAVFAGLLLIAIRISFLGAFQLACLAGLIGGLVNAVEDYNERPD